MALHRSPRKRITDAEIGRALEGSFGLHSLAAHRLGISTNTLRRRVAKSAVLLQTNVEADRSVADHALKSMIEAVRSGDVKAARWWLNHFGRNRGFLLPPSKIEVASEEMTAKMLLALKALLREVPPVTDPNA